MTLNAIDLLINQLSLFIGGLLAEGWIVFNLVLEFKLMISLTVYTKVLVFLRFFNRKRYLAGLLV